MRAVACAGLSWSATTLLTTTDATAVRDIKSMITNIGGMVRSARCILLESGDYENDWLPADANHILCGAVKDKAEAEKIDATCCGES